MKHKSLLILIILLLLLTIGVSAIARAQDSTLNEVDAPAPTAFTYQGQLKDASGTVTDSCDFQLGLWDAITDGTQIGSTLTRSGVAVSEGLFTVQLDFGANAFNGNARWLETAVRCPAGGGVYNTLSPRQPLTPAPYALYSANADKLDGQHAAAFQQHAHNLLVVAKSGGDFTTITDALNSITDNSADNPYLIYVAPGVYTEQVTMKPYVDIEGAGEQATKITYTGNDSYLTGTLITADNTELRFLTVENTGSASYSTAIFNNNTVSRLTHITATVSGATSSNTGVRNDNSSPTMMNVTIIASGGDINTGIYNNNSSPKMTNVTVTVSDGSSNCGVMNSISSYSFSVMSSVSVTSTGGTENYGVYNSESSPKMVNITAIALGGTDRNYGIFNNNSSPTMMNVITSASGGTNGYGVYNHYSSPSMMNVTASASGGTNGYGMWNFNSSATIQNSVLYGAGSYTGDGIHNSSTVSGSYILEVNNSQISGGSSTIYSDSSDYTTQVGASQLVGNGGMGPGTYICIASFTGYYTPLNSTCQP